MRFDDRITTLLDWEARAVGDRIRIWRQLVDLLAHASHLDKDVITDAIARLADAEADVPPDDRRRAIANLDLSYAPPAFLSYLERDSAVDGARLPEIVAGMPIVGVAAVPDTLVAPGAVLGSPVVMDEPQPVGASQITDLLARIDAYRARREEAAVGGFAFEIDAAGALHPLDGSCMVAHCAEPPQGVDGQAAGAWRAGAPFTDARLIAESGPHEGEWRISADPIRSEGGRVIGYRGIARAPRADETAIVPPPAPSTPSVDAFRLDAAIDGLRVPLDAIVEAADPEALPPGEIRAAAGEVIARGAALANAIDALELAVAAAGDGGIDAAALLVRIDAALQPLAEARGLRISFRLARGLPPVDADPQMVERMFARLVGAVVALGRRNERIVARLGRDRADGRMLALSVTRPGRLTGWPPQALLDPPPAPGDADAPELGLSFALRLVDRLAQEAGGRLMIHQDRIVLSLPLPAEPRTVRAQRS